MTHRTDEQVKRTASATFTSAPAVTTRACLNCSPPKGTPDPANPAVCADCGWPLVAVATRSIAQAFPAPGPIA